MPRLIGKVGGHVPRGCMNFFGTYAFSEFFFKLFIFPYTIQNKYNEV